MFFGSALFSGARGHARMPRKLKAILRILATVALVVLTDEQNSSKLCPKDFKELYDVASRDSEDRIRMCPTFNIGASHIKADRDVIGGTNICQKGVYHLLRHRLNPLYRTSDA